MFKLDKIIEINEYMKKNQFIYSLSYVMYAQYWIRRHKLKNIMFYTTDRCNSLCKHCNLWKKKKKKDLSVDIIEKIINSKSVTKLTNFGLEGGEFLLHPKYKEILSLFSDKDYTLLSNGILADKLIKTVREFNIKKINLSFDGTKETNKIIRGVDSYDNLIKIIGELKNDTQIFVTHTCGPWNTEKDYLHVKKICDDNNLGFGHNVYSDMWFLDASEKIKKINFSDKSDNDYFKNYNNWLSGNLKLPCTSINFNVVIYPNGDVPLCEYKDNILGNVYDEDFDKIWNSKKTKKLQKENKLCNGCWVSYHRISDINYNKNLMKITPKFLKNL